MSVSTRRPDLKKKLVVVGDGVYTFTAHHPKGLQFYM